MQLKKIEQAFLIGQVQVKSLLVLISFLLFGLMNRTQPETAQMSELVSYETSSVGLIGGEQGGIHRLHTGRTGEGPHQPGVDAVHVVDVQAGKEPDGVAVLKVIHADRTLFDFLVRGLRAGVEDASGEVVDEANPLGDTDLLLLCQLAGQARLTRGGVVHWRLDTLLVRRWRLPWNTGFLGLVEERQVVGALRRQTVPH